MKSGEMNFNRPKTLVSFVTEKGSGSQVQTGKCAHRECANSRVSPLAQVCSEEDRMSDNVVVIASLGGSNRVAAAELSYDTVYSS